MPPKRGRPRTRAVADVSATPVGNPTPAVENDPPPTDSTNPPPPPENTNPPPNQPENQNPPPPPPPVHTVLSEADMSRIIGQQVAAAVSQQMAAALPTLISQIQQHLPSSSGGDQHNGATPEHQERTGMNSNPDPPKIGCNYKYFASCNPPTFSGKDGATGLLKWLEGMEAKLKISQCLDEHKVAYATNSLTDQALTWWNSQIKALGTAVTDAMSWNDFKTLITAQYCPINEEQKLEEEFWNHAMVGGNNQEYNDRFHELTCLLPRMFETEEKLIQKYIKGIPQELKKIILTSECTTLKKTINMTNKLVDEAVSDGTLTINC